MKYSIAYMLESGDWDVVEEFEAEDDAAANEYAEANYPDSEWYVLDSDGNNINGW